MCSINSPQQHMPRLLRPLPLTQDALPSLLRRFAEAAQGSLQDTHYRWAAPACFTVNDRRGLLLPPLLPPPRPPPPVMCAVTVWACPSVCTTITTISLPCSCSLADYSPQLALATMLRHLPLSLREAWTFSISPTGVRSGGLSTSVAVRCAWQRRPRLRRFAVATSYQPLHLTCPCILADPEDVPVASALLHFATLFAHRRRVTPAAILHPPLSEARSEWELQQVRAGTA